MPQPERPPVQLKERKMVATQAEMAEALLPLHWRDYCAHLLIPLNACRRDTLGVPWKCGHERHAYEQCQYNDYLWRQEAQRQSKATAAAEAEQHQAAKK